MKKVIILLLFVFYPLSGFADQLKVFVSILPQKYFVEKIGRDTISAEVMVLPGHSPASYNPKPGQMKNLSEAQIYFSIGVPFEQTWLPKIRQNYNNLIISDCSEGILKRETDENFFEHHEHSDEEHHDHDHGFYDPHVWMSPLNAIKISRNMMKVLSIKNPSKKNFYRENYLSFSKEILELDFNLLKSTENIKNRNIFVFHPSWGYFMDEYSLKQIPVESQGKEPGPRYLSKIMEFAKKSNIRTLLVQPQFPSSSAKVMENTLGLNVVTADPLAEDWKNNLLRISDIIGGQ
ncbi:MAG: zinc ABC transporter substrate-binding protein [Desulfobacteraceae bacterium]|nr:zinc ABC transporter substrate-binding protein [Desulfobacteraceae bacterium]